MIHICKTETDNFVQEFLLRNTELNVLNCESLCEGLITRSRNVNGKTENSVIDFVLVCDKMLPFVKKFQIDEEKIYALSCYSKNNISYSDHNSLITRLNLEINFKKPERIFFLILETNLL